MSLLQAVVQNSLLLQVNIFVSITLAKHLSSGWGERKHRCNHKPFL